MSHMPQKVFLYASLREGFQKLARFIYTILIFKFRTFV